VFRMILSKKKKNMIPYVVLTVMEKQCVFCQVEPKFSKVVCVNFKKFKFCVTYQAFYYTDHISMAIFLASPHGLAVLKRSSSFNQRYYSQMWFSLLGHIRLFDSVFSKLRVTCRREMR
jgi:hypothetical protein